VTAGAVVAGEAALEHRAELAAKRVDDQPAELRARDAALERLVDDLGPKPEPTELDQGVELGLGEGGQVGAQDPRLLDQQLDRALALGALMPSVGGGPRCRAP
jgi:hypothetical protein